MKKIIFILFASLGMMQISLAQFNCTPFNLETMDDDPEHSKAVASVNLNGYNFTGFLVNNYQNDGRLLFLTTSFPFKSFSCYPNNGYGVYSIGGQIPATDIKFKWKNGQVTSSAKLLRIHYEFALLELNTPPPFETYSLLGWKSNNPSSSTDYCISNYPSKGHVSPLVKIKVFSTDISSSHRIGTKCNFIENRIEYDFILGNSRAIKIEQWHIGTSLFHDEYSKGAPLFDHDLKIVGLYVTSVADSCSYDNSYFAEIPALNEISGGHSYLNGITVTPCKDEAIIDYIIDLPKIEEASIRIIGRSIINNVAVVFRAGKEVLLEDGFDSGNNFIAEIAPCKTKIEELKSGTKELYNKPINQQTTTNYTKEQINAYPTIAIDRQITIECSGLQQVQYSIYTAMGQEILQATKKQSLEHFTIKLPNLSSGIYFLKIGNQKYTKTIKLIKQ